MTAVAASRASVGAAGKGATSSPVTSSKDLWSQIIAEKLSSPSTPPPREASLLFIGPHSSGKSSLIQAFMFKDREEVPKPTTALDYRYTRTSVKDQMSEEKSLSHFWELGGGATLKDLVGVAVKEGEGVKAVLVVIVVDCERVGMLVEDTLTYIDMARKKGDQLLQQMKAAGSNVNRHTRPSPQLPPSLPSSRPLSRLIVTCVPVVFQVPTQVAAAQKKRFGESHPDLSAPLSSHSGCGGRGTVSPAMKAEHRGRTADSLSLLCACSSAVPACS